MVGALFSLIGSLQRATRLSKGASTLSLVQLVGDRGPLRPSEIAERQRVHPSLVTRQLQDLTDVGYIETTADPADGRSRLVALTRAGTKERARLQQVGIDRFALFVADWEPEEVRALTALLEKLEASKAAVSADEHPSKGRRQARTDQAVRSSKPTVPDS
jgi:DNA-binding MarR family transcriptional regulator